MGMGARLAQSWGVTSQEGVLVLWLCGQGWVRVGCGRDSWEMHKTLQVGEAVGPVPGANLRGHGIPGPAGLEGPPSRPWVLKPTPYLFHMWGWIFPPTSSPPFSTLLCALGAWPLWSEASQLHT